MLRSKNLMSIRTEQEKQIEPPETPNSYCCEDREKMATAGSTMTWSEND